MALTCQDAHSGFAESIKASNQFGTIAAVYQPPIEKSTRRQLSRALSMKYEPFDGRKSSAGKVRVEGDVVHLSKVATQSSGRFSTTKDRSCLDFGHRCDRLMVPVPRCQSHLAKAQVNSGQMSQY